MATPNLVIIMSDEHDPRYMGVSGHAMVKTPNLDRLAARGTCFANAYTPSSICVPARAAFATGEYVHRIGYWDNAIAYDGRVRGWGHALQDAGIRVESIGKLHYRNAEDDAGFDAEHIPMHIYNGHGMVWGSIRDPLPDRRPHGHRMLGDYIGPGESNYTRYDRSVTAHAIEWLKARADASDANPWCLFIGFVAPHFPLVVPPEFFELYPLDRIGLPKLHPRTGYVRHPWVETHHAFWRHDDAFRDEEERLTAIAAYYGLCTWVDRNIGQVLNTLDEAGLAETTRVIYTSDHGDNVGARGLWGKSNLYQESVAVPMIMAGPGIDAGICATPVNLVDLFPTILHSFGLTTDGAAAVKPGASLLDLSAAPDDPERLAFSEYHAIGSPSGAFMLRKGRWKYHHYVGFPPELFDLETDPEETNDLAGDPAHAGIVAEMGALLRQICDPEVVDLQAKRDQAALVARFGGREAAMTVGAPGATPVPKEGS